jgi:hypothetical protein
MSGIVLGGLGCLGMFILAPLIGPVLTLIVCIPVCVVGFCVTWIELS